MKRLRISTEVTVSLEWWEDMPITYEEFKSRVLSDPHYARTILADAEQSDIDEIIYELIAIRVEEASGSGPSSSLYQEITE